MLEAGTKTPGTYVPGRRAGDHLQVITVINSLLKDVAGPAIRPYQVGLCISGL